MVSHRPSETVMDMNFNYILYLIAVDMYTDTVYIIQIGFVNNKKLKFPEFCAF